MSKKKQTGRTFASEVRVALEHMHDPVWLADHSPLATPYFLGYRLQDQYITSEQRGRILQQLLEESADYLWGHGNETLPTTEDELMSACQQGYNDRGSKSSAYRYALLELRYLRRIFPPGAYPHDTGDCRTMLGVGNNPFFEHLKKTIAQLSDIILSIVQPTSRLEQPRVNTQMIGRETILNDGLDALQSGKMVSVSGMGGVGKTTLGRMIRQSWKSGDTFWYTFRPQLNDRLDALLFHIGQFFNQLLPSGSVLWQHLLVNQGEINADQTWLGLFRHDLSQLDTITPLFCFDEVDVLRPVDLDKTESHHQTLQFFLEELHGEVPLLLIGQRVPLHADQHIMLDGLFVEDVHQLLETRQVTLHQDTIHNIHRFTRGNPRLIELLLTLHLNGDSLDKISMIKQINSIAGDSADISAIQPFLDRLWRRMDKAEQAMFATLSVFRTPIPYDAPLLDHSVITRLRSRHLIDVDGQGGIALLPFMQQMMYQSISTEQKKKGHHVAAEIRSILGEYSAAAFHYSEAGDYEAAIDCWYPHKTLEMKRGYSVWAQTTFNKISFTQLTPRHRKQLAVIHNFLYLLSGDAQQLLDQPDQLSLTDEDELTVDIRTQQAEAARMLGNTDYAHQLYQDAIETAARLTRKMVHLHTRVASLHTRNRHIIEAKQEATQAQYHTAYLQGTIALEEAQYALAEENFNEALAYAQQLDDDIFLAPIHQMLSMVAGFITQPDRAMFHAEQAIKRYLKIGDIREVENSRITLMIAYSVAEDYMAMIELGEQSLAYFEKIKEVRSICGILSNLAEAYYHTGQLEKTVQTALRVLKLEEPYYSAYVLNYLGLAYHKQGKIEFALSSFEQGIALATQTDDTQTLEMLQKSLAKIKK